MCVCVCARACVVCVHVYVCVRVHECCAYKRVRALNVCLPSVCIYIMYLHVCVHACVALPCCLFDLACFFLPSFSSLIKTCMVHVCMIDVCMYVCLLEVTKQQTCMSVISKLVT